jgi:hypothetical protein
MNGLLIFEDLKSLNSAALFLCLSFIISHLFTIYLFAFKALKYRQYSYFDSEVVRFYPSNHGC